MTETNLSIRLDSRTGPISGHVLTDDEQHEFRGWMQLATLIEALRPSAENRPDLSSPSPEQPEPPEAPPAS